MLSSSPFLFALCIPIGFFPNSWPGCFLYLLMIAAQEYFESAFDPQSVEDEIGMRELVELSFILALSILFSPIFGLSLCIIIAIRRLLWNEQRIPKKFRLSKDHYQQQQRRFLVTGAASGVGRHMVGVLSRMNHLVLATDINPSQLEVARDDDDWNTDLVVLKKLDVTNDSDWSGAIEECVSRWDGLDVLMNIAGFLKPGKVNNLTAKDIQLHVDVNVKGVMLGTSHASKLMTEQVKTGKLDHGGHIINFASLGAIAPVSGVGLYVGTKYGCRGFSLCASKDLFESGVFVTCVMPDAIQTPMVDLQLHYEESAMAYSGKILSLQDVENVLLNRVLPYREREVLIPTSLIRGVGARFADVFSGSLLLNYVELVMRQKGIQTQEATKRQNARTIAEQAAIRVRKNAITGRSPSPAPNRTRAHDN